MNDTDTLQATPKTSLRNSLYEITDELRSILAAMDDAEDGEIPPDLDTRLDTVTGNLHDKIDGVLRYRASRIARAEGLNVEIRRLQDQHATETRRAEWLKNYVATCMMVAGLQKLETKLFKLRIQKNSRPSICLIDGAAVPEQYRKITVSMDGEAAYQDWKDDKALPPQLVVIHGQHLRIS